MSSNHNGMLRMYETFGNGGANTMRRTIGSGGPGGEAPPAAAAGDGAQAAANPPAAASPAPGGSAPAGRGGGMLARDWFRPIPPPRSLTWSMRNNTNYMETGVLA